MSEQTPPYVTTAQCPEQLHVLGYVQKDEEATCIGGAYLAQGKESHTYFWIDALIYQDKMITNLLRCAHQQQWLSSVVDWSVADHGVTPVQLPVNYGWQDVPRKHEDSTVTDDDIVMWYSTRLAEECEKLRQRVIRWDER